MFYFLVVQGTSYLKVSVSDFETHGPGLTLTEALQFHQEGHPDTGIKVLQRSNKMCGVVDNRASSNPASSIMMMILYTHIMTKIGAWPDCWVSWSSSTPPSIRRGRVAPPPQKLFTYKPNHIIRV